MIKWPSNILPLPSINFSGTNQSSVIRTQMDSGRFRQRRRFTKELDILSIEWLFDGKEWLFFRSFFEHSLEGGSLWFNINVNLGDRTPIGEESVQTFKIRFVSGYSYTYAPVNYWRVRGSIEIDNFNNYSAELLSVLISEDGDLSQFIIDANSLEDEMQHFGTGNEHDLEPDS